LRSDMREGLNYMWSERNLRYKLLQLLLSIACVLPLMFVVFRVYVQERFQLDAAAFGKVFSFPALGSMAGAVIFAVIKPREPVRALLFGVPLASVMLVVVPWMPSLSWTMAAISFCAFGLYLTFASLTVSLQLEVDNAYRGRLSAVIGMGFSAIGPLMAFPWGHMADAAGAPRTIWICAGLFALGSFHLAVKHHLARKRHLF
jgi:MFS transporter, DHA3 family, macrolide efflux protein